MISAILYGRNDSYGYNLHKRAALSLNCISEILTESTDELLFVDYNTPDDYPTFPEAIQDTLTERAKERLRILRVRPAIHERHRQHTHLVALEPIARNVAVRRTNRDNRWILSTNTDMIFVPQAGMSLSSLVTDLPKGFYHLPRFEIPETLWETFDRKDARGTIDAIRYWARVAHLNEIVLGTPFIRFDGPGDFQLIEREDLFRIHGFDESMLLGWHVDSNIAKRLHLLHGETKDLLDRVYGYHCDHTRQVTPMHRRDSVTNDLRIFVDGVEKAERDEQAEIWGCAGEEIEEIRLAHTRNRVYLDGIRAVIKEEMIEPTTAAYVPETYNKVTYDPAHVLPFLADIFVNAPVGTSLAWVGGNPEMFRLFAALWREMGFGGALLVYDRLRVGLGSESGHSHKVSTLDGIADEADAIVFDYCDAGGEESDRNDETIERREALIVVQSAFVELVEREQRRMLAGRTPRRFVGVNAIHNSFESLVSSFLGVTRTPFGSRIRQGFVLAPETGALDWTARMSIGSAGVKVGAEVWTAGIKKGHVMYGPYARLLPGRYRVGIDVKSCTEMSWRLFHWRAPAVFDVVAGRQELTRRAITHHELAVGRINADFEVRRSDVVAVDAQGVEVRIKTAGFRKFGIAHVEVQRLS
jgi:hypothetical protein